MKLRAFLGSLAVVGLIPAQALALGDYVKLGVGAQFQAGAEFYNKPGDQTVNGQQLFPEYPGFVGPTLGGGGFIDVRFIDHIGLELGILYTSDKGSATLTINEGQADQTKFDVTIKHNAIHMPLLVKGVLPGTIARAFFFLGPEFVFPVVSCPGVAASGESVTDYANDHPNCSLNEGNGQFHKTEGPLNTDTAYFINTAKYVMVTGGFGVEFALPIPKVDIRIPLSLRVSGNPAVSGKRTDREFDTIVGNRVTAVEYTTNWWLQGVANLGVGIYF